MNTLNVKLNPHLYDYIMDNPDKFGVNESDGYHKTHNRIYEILEANMSKEELLKVDALIGILLNENEASWFSIGWNCAKNPEKMVIV